MQEGPLSTQSDSLELFQLDRAKADDDEGRQEHAIWSSTKTRSSISTTLWGSIKARYSRIILRSGKGYDRLPEKSPNPRGFHGWRFGALLSCIVVGICLGTNIGVTIFLRKEFPSDGNRLVTLVEDDCTKVKSLDSKIHYAINMMASILVSASNYNMQCLTAPTRAEVDRAHQRGTWLDIGVHSIRNLPHIGRTKPILWLGLLLSSLPLHLLWNSAVFMTTTFNDYSGLVVTSDFVYSDTSIGIDCTEDAMERYRFDDEQRYVTCWLHDLARNNGENMTKLDAKNCREAYRNGIGGTKFNLLAITKDTNGLKQSKAFAPPSNVTLPVIAYFHPMSYPDRIQRWCEGLCNDWGSGGDDPEYCHDTGWDNSTIPISCQRHMVNGTDWEPDGLSQTTYWMCDTDAILYGECSDSAVQSNSSSVWSILPEHYEIESCFTTNADHSCQLQYSPLILYIAIVCNATKFLSILLCLVISSEPILATVGDALDTFLKRPEPESEGRCLLSRLDDDIVPRHNCEHRLISYPAQPWVHGPGWIERWYQGSSLKRWGICILLWLTCIIIGAIFLVKGVNLLGSQDIFSVGFGAINMDAIVNISSYRGGTTSSILSTSLIVNLPQLLLSGLYFMYNAVVTGMTSAYEWSLFAYKKTTLRVTVPSGAQRETYWLQLPWRYSLPLVICSIAFHWLISQSIFLINILIYQPNNELLTKPTEYFPTASPSGVITGCGYSPMAILCALGVGFVMFIALAVISSRKLKPGIPVVGSCSFAISAACHPPNTDEGAAMKPLSWGAIRHQENDQPGHCCLTSFEVESPRHGGLYAG